jgi:outer membrane protein assembly factor BamA
MNKVLPFGIGRCARFRVARQALCTCILAGFALVTVLKAQSVCIDTILYEGLKRTKTCVILRELGFKNGDCMPLPALKAELEQARLRLMNTALFNDACLEVLEQDSGHVVVGVHLTETWYFVPMPIFDLADRNFNVWWNEFDRSFQRVNYGLNLHHGNLTGHRDVFKLDLQFGYTNSFGFSYSIPAINKKQTLGISVGASFNRNREVAFTTSENKPVFLRNPNGWQLQRLQSFVGLNWRPGFFTTHQFLLEYRDNQIADSIGQVFNPDFFLEGRTNQQYSSFSYSFVKDRRDWRPYPMSGDKMVLEVRQNGILPTDDMHICRLYAEYTRHIRFGQKWSSGFSGRLRTTLPRQSPPYFNNQALGYGGNTVRGFEYFVADGLDFAVVKMAVRRQLFDKVFRIKKGMPFENFKVCPLKMYVSAGSDFGYANDPHYKYTNPFVNRVLWGGGLGLDVVAWYDKVARFEWSITDTGLSGFYVSMNMGF